LGNWILNVSGRRKRMDNTGERLQLAGAMADLITEMKTEPHESGRVMVLADSVEYAA
jgi:hypothetical protein